MTAEERKDLGEIAKDLRKIKDQALAQKPQRQSETEAYHRIVKLTAKLDSYADVIQKHIDDDVAPKKRAPRKKKVEETKPKDDESKEA